MQGSDIWLASLNSTLGSEVQKSRSCVVNSPPETNEHLRTVASMTTGSWPAPFRIPVTSQCKNGLVLLDQLRALDRQRQVERLGS
ncbi:MAG: type II toxin-antitoxin system PemK/MazF family toxin, partial [Burkholderiaceae bacterium]